MNNEEILLRVQTRISDDVSKDTLLELIQTVADRVCLRIGVDKLPSMFRSVVVDATVKLYRRTYYEGISSEGDDGISTSFVNDILEEYSDEFEQYRQACKSKIKFL